MRSERLRRFRPLLLIPIAGLLASGAALHASADDLTNPAPPRPTRQEPPKPAKPAAAPTDDTQSTADLPDADTVLANYVKAIGGEERLRKNTSRRVTGKFEMSAMPGMSAPMVINSMAPNLMVLTITLPGMGEMKQGFDGEHGWSMDPMQGPMLMPEEQVRQFQRDADFNRDLNFRKHFPTIEVVGRSEFETRAVWTVRMTDQADDSMTAHFGVDDHLLWGVETVSRSPMGEMPSRSVIKEYADFDGMKVASRTEVQAAGMVQTLVIEKIEFDVLGASDFELPPAVRTLVDAKKGQKPPDIRTPGS